MSRVKDMVVRQMGNIIRLIEKINILKVKFIIYKFQNSLKRLKIRQSMPKSRLSELEDKNS